MHGSGVERAHYTESFLVTSGPLPRMKKVIIATLHTVFQYLFFAALGAALIAFDPFGVGNDTENAWQDVLYRLLAPLYDSTARDDILVVLVTEETTTHLYEEGYFRANEWPLTYADQGRLISDILAWKPRALFVDINFRIERSTDDSFDTLARRLSRQTDDEPRIPILWARDNASDPLLPFQQKLNALGAFSINGWRGVDGYPLAVEDLHTVAVDLYRLACAPESPLAGCATRWQDTFNIHDRPMSVIWGNRVPTLPIPSLISETRCTPMENSGWDLAWRAAQSLWLGLFRLDNDHLLQSCPYHAVIYADQLIALKRYGTPEQQAAFAERLQDRILMYATDLIGLHDVVQSPAHGELPGVMYHAMALDNLMTLGSGYIRAVDGETDNILAWLVLAWVFVLCQRFGLDAKTTFLVCTLMLVGSSIVQVIWLRLEPSNAIGLLGFVAGIQILIRLDPGNLTSELRRLRARLVYRIMRKHRTSS